MKDELKLKLVKENRILINMIKTSAKRILDLNPDMGFGDLLGIYGVSSKDFNYIGIDIIELYKKESNYHET